MDQIGIVEYSGFPNPATDTTLTGLNINSLLIKHPASTFFMIIDTAAWEELGIFKHDIAIVDRALMARKGDLIVYWNDPSFALARYPHISPNTTVWGVISSIVHQYRKAGA